MDPAVSAVADPIPDGRGVIGLLSSDEFTPPVRRFDEELLEATGPRVALLLCADPEAADQQAGRAREHYASLGAEPTVLDVLERSDAGPGKLPDCDVLFLGGGSPSVLLECLDGTVFWEEALKRWASGMALAGSSAGAMALCGSCLTPEPGASMPTTWTRGIGPLEGFGLAVHAATRPDTWVREVARSAPAPVVAMDDATGMILRPGTSPVRVGEGRVLVVDASG